MPEERQNAANPPVAGQPVDTEVPSRRMPSLGRSLSSVLGAGRVLLARRRSVPAVKVDSAEAIIALCRELLQHRGEASGMALASEIVDAYWQLSESQREQFLLLLAGEFAVDREAVLEAAENYRIEGGYESLIAINKAMESPRQKLFGRINMAPEGTRTLVAMRGHLIDLLPLQPELKEVEFDLKSLFFSWFNKGFLELRRIDWSSPAIILEKIIRYEAVHEINGWDDLRSRLSDDRRCFAFFHPAMDDEPLVFVEIALTDAVPNSMEPLLNQEREQTAGEGADTVVFYSICNCHQGLVGISFGYFLIKAVIEALREESDALKTFVTLSPVPGFRRWLLDSDLQGLVAEELADRVREPVGRVVDAKVYDALLKLCAHYLVNVKSGVFPREATARFHLGNGAQLHALHGGADLSAKGLEQSAGIMVNYLYDLPHIEENHEAYMDQGQIATSRAVNRLIT